jgi:preprotein translocase subunit YajC
MSSYLTQLALTSHGLVVLAASSATKTSTNSTTPFLILIGVVLLVYFFVFRGRNQQRRRATQDAQSVTVGDEVMLTSGIIGRITELDGDRASIEIAPDIEIEVVRRAIAQRVPPVEPAEESDDAPGDGYSEAPYAHNDLADGDDEDNGDEPEDTSDGTSQAEEEK